MSKITLNDVIIVFGTIFFGFWIIIVGTYLTPEIIKNDGSLRFFYPLSIVFSAIFVVYLGLIKSEVLKEKGDWD